MGFALRDPRRIGGAALGAGRMAQTHLRTLAGIDNADVVVVADPVQAAAERGAEIANARRWALDPLEAIRDPEVEAVVIVTPTSTHASLIEEALRAGKAVWTEMPIAQDLSDTRRIVDLWRELEIPLAVGAPGRSRSFAASSHSPGTPSPHSRRCSDATHKPHIHPLRYAARHA